MYEETKSWYASRTIWFAIIYAVIAWGPPLLSTVGYGDWVAPDALVEWVSMLTPVIVALLRKVTTKPLA